MDKLRKIIKEAISEAWEMPFPHSPRPKNFEDMNLKGLRDQIAWLEEKKQQTQSPFSKAHDDSLETDLYKAKKALSDRMKAKGLKEHYVDTEWSRQGLEPSLPDPREPVMYSEPHMQAVGDSSRKLYENNGDRTVVFSKKVNPSTTITIKIGRDSRIAEIENERGLRFPFSIGQSYNRSFETWACVNGFLMDGKDTCGEKKIFGVNVKDVPQGHEWRTLFPGKFRK